jgi:EAL domain-containing protein (putative c-di-GMP-specific phosphodiesterase class I)
MLAPDAFIGLAEESGLILPIGEWVIRTAIRDAQRWDASGHAPVRVAVNISAVQFRQPDLGGTIQGILTESGFPAERLEVELTESVAMGNPDQAVHTIARLNDLGVHVAIDDFGTGYSSMAYLKRFRIGRVKIDRSFVANLGHERDEEAIVTAIVDMAAALRCTAIAEGVETIEQLDFLKAAGCAEIQGYLISRPVPQEELAALLTSASVLPASVRD